MKIRNELNAELFRQKMDNFKRSEHSVKPVEFTSICNGDMDAVKLQLSEGELALIADDRLMSKNKLKTRCITLFYVHRQSLPLVWIWACGRRKPIHYLISMSSKPILAGR